MNSAPVHKQDEEPTGSQGGTLVLQPGQLIRPRMTSETATALIRRLYGFQPSGDVSELPSYDDRNYYVIVDGRRHSNPHVTDVWPHGYVLKVLNSLDSRKTHVGEQASWLSRVNYTFCE
jgi:hydroxylysine kinase